MATAVIASPSHSAQVSAAPENNQSDAVSDVGDNLKAESEGGQSDDVFDDAVVDDIKDEEEII